MEILQCQNTDLNFSRPIYYNNRRSLLTRVLLETRALQHFAMPYLTWLPVQLAVISIGARSKGDKCIWFVGKSGLIEVGEIQKMWNAKIGGNECPNMVYFITAVKLRNIYL